MKLTLRRNTISPSLRRAAATVKDKRSLLDGMALAMVQLTKRAFNEPSLRPAPWPRLASGKAARLRRNNVLARSPRVYSVSQTQALIGTDRKYAAIHQLGGRTPPRIIRAKPGSALFWPGAAHPVKEVKHPGSKIPARPFFPFLGRRGKPTRRAVAEMNAVLKKRLAKKIKG